MTLLEAVQCKNFVIMSANKNILSVSRLDIKPTGARQIWFSGREKWFDPTWNVQIDL